MTITKDTRPSDIEALRPFLNYLMYKCVPADKPAVEMSFAEMHENQPTWDTDSMIRGAEFLAELAGRSRILYDVYTREECADDPEKADVKLLYLPAKGGSSDKPFVVAVSGGAYTCVCSLVEAIPTGRILSELGYNVFVFNYRCMRDPLFPLPVEDLAAAIRCILSRREVFGIRSDEYIVNGFSAGGNLTAVWGTDARGYAHYRLPKPKALFAVYPFISFDAIADESSKKWFRRMMFGSQADEGDSCAYDVPRNFTDGFPPCYIVQAKDDPAVPVRNSLWLKELLDEHRIPAELELIETGGHGWGDGSGTAAAGWPKRAAAFAEAL